MEQNNKLTLGIAKIGDLLLRNRIEDTDAGALENISLKIPEYQRPYKWTARNVNQLLDDIEDAMKRNREVYRVGTLILHHDRETNTYNIVDGQQRTITFALMLKCLYDREEKGGEGHTKIRFLEQKLSGNPYNLRNVRNNYRALARRLGRTNGAEDAEQKAENAEHNLYLTNLRRYIEDCCELIVVITTDLSEAFQFFDSQNARGKALYPHDLLKAYHLREMDDMDPAQTEKIVKRWEDLNQSELARLFNDYLYRLKCWLHGKRANVLSDQNIDMFKGVSARDQQPYAQFYKGAFAYADQLNRSYVPFVTGLQNLTPFQIDAPIIAGAPFFAYTQHYYAVLKDIRNNEKYEGYLVNDNPIIKTLELPEFRNGIGNGITRLMLDTAVLLYADRFCPGHPSQEDLNDLDRFLVYAFVWAYSMRAQYYNVGWSVAQNYILGTVARDGIVNSFNLYRIVSDANTSSDLLNQLADRVRPIGRSDVRIRDFPTDLNASEKGVYQHYLHYFVVNHFWREDNGGEQ